MVAADRPNDEASVHCPHLVPPNKIVRVISSLFIDHALSVFSSVGSTPVFIIAHVCLVCCDTSGSQNTSKATHKEKLGFEIPDTGCVL